MKYIILLLISFNVFASENCFILNNLNDSTKQRIACAKGFTPKNIIARAPIDPVTKKQIKDIALVSDRLIDVDDKTKPIYRDVIFLSNCDDESACAALIDKDTCPAGENARYDDKANHETIDGEGWFFWCEKRTGYEKKKVKEWYFDQAKHDAKELEKTQKEAEKLAKKNQKEILKAALQKHIDDKKISKELEDVILMLQYMQHGD